MENEKIELAEILSDLEFDYVINKDNSLSLIDLQGANLGNIESETFNVDSNIATLLIDRLNNYIYDYYINGYLDTIRYECHEDVEDWNFEDILNKMKMYPDKFEGCINLMEAFVNPELFDISQITEDVKITTNCFRCGTRLRKSVLPDYFYYCPECYEDFYEFEQKGIK